MSRIGDDGTVEPGTTSATKQAWVQTNEDMTALAEQRRDEGWETVAIPAAHTAPLSRDAGRDDRFGIVHVIPGNHADAFADAFENREFPRYEAYRNEVGQAVFFVTELLDPETSTAILLAGQYEFQNAPGMVNAAEAEGCLYTHVETLDGTILGSFRHDEYKPLIPDRIR
ncbi:DUF7529 family protein [Haloterrigena alkaliphila]|uniref:Uncharacterized protein n=1 Tax=Haloterrigena alkaliphila TaxID=2816475 RepID=A0A8A2VBE4_9EURY|nr:hypothetical protein [Haloterrigena alkaliphila]QSW98037.1 hypothetical protein J0X25_11505 [Haloterrigena alkaliphila]